MAERGVKRKNEEIECQSKKRSLAKNDKLCCLRSCSIPIEEDRVEIVGNTVGSDDYILDWDSKGGAVLHTDCWNEVLRNARMRRSKGATIKIPSVEKSLIKEAAKTAEFHDSQIIIQSKAKKIADLIVNAKYGIVFTGAGISTSAGIGDYRGKSGKWTEQDRQGIIEDTSTSTNDDGVPYEELRPTYTHEALAKLVEMGLIKHVISQNGDGLHCLSGIPKDYLSELHGNVFLETCEDCGEEYDRPFYVLDDTSGQYYEDINESGQSSLVKPSYAVQCTQCDLSHRTGRSCDTCGGHLKDSIINFGDDLQEDVLTTAERVAEQSDLCISLGTTMTVTPACDLVLMGQKPLHLVIVNRQKTHFDYLCVTKDDKKMECGVRVFGDCDSVMREVMVYLMKEKDKIKWEKERQIRLQVYDKNRKQNK